MMPRSRLVYSSSPTALSSSSPTSAAVSTPQLLDVPAAASVADHRLHITDDVTGSYSVLHCSEDPDDDEVARINAMWRDGTTPVSEQWRDVVLATSKRTPVPLQRAFILSGYRVALSHRAAMQSLWHLHNEFFNVWTHVFGVVATIVLLVIRVLAAAAAADDGGFLAQAPTIDKVVFGIYYVACLILFWCSVRYHLFSCRSEKVRCHVFDCDIQGICVIMIASYIIGLHFAFYCTPVPRWIYTAVVSAIVLATLALPKVRHRFSSVKQMQLVRQVLLVAVAVCSIVPIVHICATRPWPVVRRLLIPISRLLGIYGVAFGIWLTRVPERWWPGMFDTYGHSHTIWHTLILIATYSWEYSMRGLCEWRVSHDTCVIDELM